MQMCFTFLILFIFNSFTKEMLEENGRYSTAVGYLRKFSGYIHEKYVDMDMDGKFHIHGKPEDAPKYGFRNPKISGIGHKAILSWMNDIPFISNLVLYGNGHIWNS